MASHAPKSNYSQDLQQDPLEHPRPRHPYAFCQCAGEDCVACLRDEIDVLKQELEDTKQSLAMAQMIARVALRENQIHREEKLGLPHTVNIPANVGGTRGL